MVKRDMTGRLAIITLLGLALTAGTASAQTAPQRVGDSASLSSGVPIIALETVDAGQQVTIVVDGAPQGASIEIWGPVGDAGGGGRLGLVPLTGGSAVLAAPEVPGSYELRYVDASGKQLGRRALDVAAVPVALTVLTPVSPGGAMDVTWQGPARPGDRFEIVSTAGTLVDSMPLAGNPAAVNVSRITAPAERGTYQLRYVTDAGWVLRGVPFEVR